MQSNVLRSERVRLSFIAVAALLTVGGCDYQQSTTDAPPVRTASEKSGPTSAATADSALPSSTAASDSSASSVQQAYDGMKFYVPRSWKQLPLSQMQMGIIAAKFGLPEIGEEISLTLSTSGGSIEDNIQRWQGQFRDGEAMTRDTMTADGREAVIVRLQGTFSAGFGRSSEENWRMTGVIIPMSQHNYYIKLTGPAEEVIRAEDEFIAFCKSARRE